MKNIDKDLENVKGGFSSNTEDLLGQIDGEFTTKKSDVIADATKRTKKGEDGGVCLLPVK